MSQQVIEIDQVRARYRRQEVLRGVDLGIDRGSITALLGANGSGKSTLLRTLVGIQPLTHGRVRVQGIDPFAEGVRVRRNVCLLPTGGTVMPAETALTHFAFGHKIYPKWNPQRALATARELHVPLDRNAGRLSTGQRMGLALSFAFGTCADVLLLDEPTNGLDPDHRSELMRVLVEYAADGNTVLYTSHVLPEVEGLADTVAFLKDGVVALHSDLDQLRLQNVTIQAVLGTPVEPAQLQTISNLSDVDSVQANGRIVSVNIRGNFQAVRDQLLEWRPIDIQTLPRPLSDVYTEYIGGEA